MGGSVTATKFWYEDYSVINRPGFASRQPRAHRIR